MDTNRPLIVQSDLTMLLEVKSPLYAAVRDELLAYAEIVKSPEYFHTYRLSRLSLWNAAALGWTGRRVLQSLGRYSRFPVPPSVEHWIADEMTKYGILTLKPGTGNNLLLTGADHVLQAIVQLKPVQALVDSQNADGLTVSPESRGELKRTLAKLGYPVKDLVGYVKGADLAVSIRKTSRKTGVPFELRKYQSDAVDAFFAGSEGGSGVIVLPCGSGKTVVGLGVLSKAKTHTLVLTPNTVALHQWISEIVDKLCIKREQVGEYSSESRTILPVTVTTYQMLTHRKGDTYPHFEVLNRAPWGLIIYDEVHLLPAPIFRLTADLQGRMRLGLTATLVREDGAEEDVFSLIGPKKYDVPWREMENQGWIAKTTCYEVSVPMSREYKMNYLTAEDRLKFRIAAENPTKLNALKALIRNHADDKILIIGQYIEQLEKVGRQLRIPVVTGKSSVRDRERLYEAFRSGEVNVLAVSKVANVALDLPDANVAVQISGTFGSRQEEAQRLGRILRPNSNGRESIFYSLVTRESKDEERSNHRQLFLTEQGYQYVTLDAEELIGGHLQG